VDRLQRLRSCSAVRRSNSSAREVEFRNDMVRGSFGFLNMTVRSLVLFSIFGGEGV
jgi:hypothetical protein